MSLNDKNKSTDNTMVICVRMCMSLCIFMLVYACGYVSLQACLCYFCIFPSQILFYWKDINPLWKSESCFYVIRI